MNDPNLLQMIYALEWYDIPRHAYADLVYFHPYLTKGDDTKIYYISKMHLCENLITLSLFTLVSNRLLLKLGKNYFKIRRFARTQASLLIGGAGAYVMNRLFLNKWMLGDIKSFDLDKYLTLDLNADWLR